MKFYFFINPASEGYQVLGRIQEDGKFYHPSSRGKIILLGWEEKINKEGHYVAELIEKEKCFIAIRVVKQNPLEKEEKISEDKYYPQVRYFNEKYLKTKNLNTGETEIVCVGGVDPSPIFKMSEDMLPYKEEILAYYEELTSSSDRWVGDQTIREVIEPELLFGNLNEYHWGFYRIHKNSVSLCSTDIGVGGKKVYFIKKSERRVLVPHNILRKKLLRHEAGRMAVMGVAAAFGGPRGCNTSNPIEEYIVACENRIVRATVKTSIYWDSNEEEVLQQQELSRKEWEDIVAEDRILFGCDD